MGDERTTEEQTGLPLPPALVDYVLLGPADDRRQLQDSPILGDVWVEFGKKPAAALDLLISPYKTEHAGRVAAEISSGLEGGPDEETANIAYLQGLVVARLSFQEVLRVVVPKTKWWLDKWAKNGNAAQPEGNDQKGAGPATDQRPTAACRQHELDVYMAPREVETRLERIIMLARDWQSKSTLSRAEEQAKKDVEKLGPLDRFVALSALILWAGQAVPPTPADRRATVAEQISVLLDIINPEKAAELFVNLVRPVLEKLRSEVPPEPKRGPLVWQISLNRVAMPALTKSVPAVKADAAKTLFKVDCSEITWAVLDGGIAGTHPAFLKADLSERRIKKSFDFGNFRRIVSLGNKKPRIRRALAEELMTQADRLVQPPKDEDEADDYLGTLAKDAENRGPIHWELVERFIEIKPTTPAPGNHATHVAGIIGASKAAVEAATRAAATARAAAAAAAKTADEAAVKAQAARGTAKAAAQAAAQAATAAADQARAQAAAAAERAGTAAREDVADGMCPDISLYDFRVLGSDIKDAEFAIIAALQFIQYLNNRDNFFTIHGANLSLSIPHDVRNFACGRTPICVECERLVDSGVVVVAAAGNHGYKSYETDEGAYKGYTAFSITDPGNADSVITVGATHRFWPHTYGVSFFSSRGPTGDGRLKPDLVAPGERIRAPLPGGTWGDLDGTSMAAPHVSGAAALLMARYSELIGQPRRIKRILCDSATDLGRERSFQGHGMLDVLRAFQSI